ncbi:unnamed protein product [Blepharisma stoltei]|uniref:Uncharacterized protein n=1 Tax=Blepharisma stoltei TaxID=1481888 RepID=A0AAU9IPJ5_9CILI|nr:unnamed protein product [Blepharisma stoltei]
MGCGGSKNEAKAPTTGSSNQGSSAQVKPSANQTSAEDHDLMIEISGTRTDKKGNQISIYDRSEQRPEDNQAMVGLFEMEEAGAGEQALAVKPWLGAIKAPSNAPAFQNQPPNINMRLEYAYGYRCFDSRQNLFYTSNPNQVVYMTAALGVVLDKSNNTQKFFGAGNVKQANGHSDDITALAVTTNRDLVATGEVGQNPKICVWSVSNPEAGPRVDVKLGRGRRAVSCLGFSFDGRYLAACDMHNDHYVSVWEVSTGRKVAEQKGGPDKILDVCWSKTELKFCTAGIKHIYFWTLDNGTLTNNKGLFGSQGEATNMTSAQWFGDGTAVTGGQNGMLYHWQDRELRKTVQVHGPNQCIHALSIVNDTIISGGKDNKIIILDKNFQKTKEINAGSCPKSLDMSGSNILAGLRDGSIKEFSSSGSATVLMESHSDGEIWGVANDPSNNNVIVTVGDDNKVKAWDTAQRKCISSGTLDNARGVERKAGAGASTLATTTPNQQARGIAIHPQNGHVAVTHNDGKVTIRQGVRALDTVVFTLKDPKEWSEAIRYSPDGSKLAVGSHDNAVYIYNVAQNYKLIHKLNKHSSYITAIDWSVDGSAMHSTCGAYELLFWDITTGQQVPDGCTRYQDENWATWSTHFGWPVQGIFGGVVDYTHVNRVDRSHNGEMVAVGNDWGLVEIFGFPNNAGAKSQAFRGHSEHVMNVKWSHDDRRIFSAGGYDQTIMQWLRA